MPPMFLELAPCNGVDEKTASGGAAIIVPYKGSNSVVVVDATRKDYKVGCRTPGVDVAEIADFSKDALWSKLQNLHIPVASVESGARLFEITGNICVGLNAAQVEATNRHTLKPEAALKVLVLRPLNKKISIRSTQVLVENNKTVSFTNTQISADGAQKLLDGMNAIWQPQANISFQLGRTEPALIKGLKPDSRADLRKDNVLGFFVSSKDPAADLTMFLVQRAFDGDEVDGVTNAKEGVTLISDHRLNDTTLAHEAGHFVGALNENGKYSKPYPDNGTDLDFLMSRGHTGYRIPYSQVTDLNKGYTRS